MKKAITLLLSAALVLSLAACGAKPAAAPTSPAAAPTPAATPAAPAATPAPESSSTPVVVEEPAAKFPLSYPATNKAGDDMKQVFGAQEYYKADTEVTIEYCQAQDDLYNARNGKSSWPEFSDEWKGYGYTNIVNSDGVSARTFATGLYGERHATVIKDNQEKMKAICEVKSSTDAKAPEGEILVPYSKLEIPGQVTIEKVADVAQQALYLQAWLLVPAKYQGVLVSANGTDYTPDMILKEMGK